MTPEGPWGRGLRAVAGRARRLPWNRAGALLGIVTIGFSEILFSLIGENLDYFPSSGGFYFWLIVWGQIVPFAILMGLESLLIRGWGEIRVFHVWRGGLYTLCFLSFVRQLQVHHPDLNRPLVLYHSILAVTLLTAASLILFLAALRFHKGVHAYVSWLGLLGVMLTGSFVVQTGMLSPAPTGKGAEPPGEVRKDLPHVFVLLFDELAYDVLVKDGAVDRQRFPHFAALADESLWFTDATTNAYYTKDAIPTIFTGFFEPPPDAPTLFDLLPGDYDIRVRLSVELTRRWLVQRVGQRPGGVYLSSSERLFRNPFEVPSLLALALARSPYAESPFIVYHYPDIQGLPPMIFKDGVYTHALKDVEEFIEELREVPGSPQFTFWHCFLPHHPFVLTPEGEVHDDLCTMFRSGPMGKMHLERRLRESGREYRTQDVLNNYVRQVRFLDRQVGRIVEALKASGLYEESVLVLTTDHGLRSWGELEPEGHPDVMGSWAPRIPLVIRAPGIQPGVRDGDYQHLDLVATLLDLVGYPEKASGTEGVSALSHERPERRKRLRWILEGETRLFVREREGALWRRTSIRKAGKGD